MTQFLYRLFFTRDDDLDVLQLVYVLFIAMLCRMQWTIALAYSWKDLPSGWWWTNGAILGYLAITGVPRWAADLVARKAVEALPGRPLVRTRPTVEPNLWVDDER